MANGSPNSVAFCDWTDTESCVGGRRMGRTPKTPQEQRGDSASRKRTAALSDMSSTRMALIKLFYKHMTSPSAFLPRESNLPIVAYTDHLPPCRVLHNATISHDLA
jgi:hypothetical protein